MNYGIAMMVGLLCVLGVATVCWVVFCLRELWIFDRGFFWGFWATMAILLGVVPALGLLVGHFTGFGT